MTAVKTSFKTDAQVSHLADNGLPVTSADVRRLVAEKKVLEDALRPFADHANDWREFSDDESLVECDWPEGPHNATFLTVGHLRIARAALRSEQGESDEG